MFDVICLNFMVIYKAVNIWYNHSLNGSSDNVNGDFQFLWE